METDEVPGDGIPGSFHTIQLDEGITEDNGHAYNNRGMMEMVAQEPETRINTVNTEKLGDYEPYDNRNVAQPTTYRETLMHLLKASLGTGVLAMPSAFKNSGYLVGTFGTFFAGILCTYTIQLLIRSSYKLCKRRRVPSLSYDKTVEASFEDGPPAFRRFSAFFGIATNNFLFLYQLGSSCVYVVFIAKNLKSIGDPLFDVELNERMYMLFMLIPMILISWVRNWKTLAPFSTLATYATTGSFMLIFTYILDVPWSSNILAKREPIGEKQEIPMFFGTVLFAMEAIGVVLPLENEMRNPREFGSRFGVLHVAMIPIAILYVSVGLFGYLKYGPSTCGSITLNLPKEGVLPIIIKSLLIFSIYICYALSNFVAFDIAWKRMTQYEFVDANNRKWDFGLRTTLVLITFTFSMLVNNPRNFEMMISIIGAVCLSAVGIAFPAVVNYLTFAEESRAEGVWAYRMLCLKTVMLLLVAGFAFTMGVTSSISDLLKG